MVSRNSDTMKGIGLFRRSVTEAPDKQNDEGAASRRAGKDGDSRGIRTRLKFPGGCQGNTPTSTRP